MPSDRLCARTTQVAVLMAPILLVGSLVVIQHVSVLEQHEQASAIVRRARAPRLSPEERKESLLAAFEPGAPAAWGDFSRCVVYFQTGADRAEAARRFREFVSQYPDARYVSYFGTRESYTKEARELALLLEQLVQEDKAWMEPEDPTRLSLDERIRYDIYHLRDVEVWQSFGLGGCDLLSPLR